MKLSLLSDLHFECHKDGGESFIESLDSSNIDILLLAGDIGTLSYLEGAIKRFCDKYPQVILVAGNHEFWGSDRKTITNHLNELSSKINNFKFLDNQIFEYKDKRFLGTTLWFGKSHPNLCARWSDFYKIKDFDKWIYEQNIKSIDFLIDNLSPKDVVITHHLPSEKSISYKYKGDSTNCFYVCNMDKLIEERNPKLWCHGHTHESMNYEIGNTQIACNPFGYVGYELNKNFNDKLIIEI